MVELDVTDPAQHAALTEDLRQRWGTVDGALHAVGFAPEVCLGQDDGLLSAEWDDVATALHVSTYSLKSLAQTVLPLMPAGGSIVGLDFDATQAWPAYDWMGVAKAALEATTRYLARDLGPRGIRVNLVAAGPAAHAGGPVDPRTSRRWRVPGGRGRRSAGTSRDPEPVARACVALLSDWFPATTGEIVHVDGGVHAVALAPGEAGPPAAAPATDEAGSESAGSDANGSDAPVPAGDGA